FDPQTGAAMRSTSKIGGESSTAFGQTQYVWDDNATDNLTDRYGDPSGGGEPTDHNTGQRGQQTISIENGGLTDNSGRKVVDSVSVDGLRSWHRVYDGASFTTTTARTDLLSGAGEWTTTTVYPDGTFQVDYYLNEVLRTSSQFSGVTLL